MMAKSIYKVPNGKLLKITLDYDDGEKTINSIKITGDFFAYPDDSIEMIEGELKNSILDKKSLTKKIDKIINRNNFEFIGLNAEGIATGIMMCVGDKND